MKNSVHLDYTEFHVRTIGFSLLTLILFIFCSSSLYYVIEKKANDSDHDHDNQIESYNDALYFTMITLSTIGYGDVVPRTRAGKVLNVLFILSSIFGLFVLFRITLGYMVDYQLQGIIDKLMCICLHTILHYTTYE